MGCVCNSYQLENYGCKCEFSSLSEEKLETPRCFANVKSGDLYIVWWNVNAPVINEETGWVEISEKAWRIWSRMKGE